MISFIFVALSEVCRACAQKRFAARVMWWIAFHFQQEVDRFQDPRLKDTYLGPFHLIARYMTMFYTGYVPTYCCYDHGYAHLEAQLHPQV